MKVLTLVYFSLFCSNLLAQTFIHKIEVRGNKRTDPKIILNEGELFEGRVYTEAQLKEARARILNLEIFAEVDLKIQSNKGSEEQLLIVEVNERWTTIPIVKVSSGGGVSEVIAGIYDANLFGKYIEAGGQLQRLGERNSGVVWSKFPRLTNKLQLDTQFWQTSRIRVKYDQEDPEPIVNNGFTQIRTRAYLALSYRLEYDKIFGIFYEYNEDRFENDLNFQDLIDTDFSNESVSLPVETQFHFIGLNFVLGRVDRYREFFSGHRASGNVRYGFSENEIENFGALSLKFEYYKRFKKDFNFASRTQYDSNDNSQNIQYLIYHGGFDSIRGFKDNRFSGNTTLALNNEIRYSFWREDLFTIQGVSFLDYVMVSNGPDSLTQQEAASVGVGARLFLPNLFRFVVRLDFAKAIIKEDDESINFGFQQFF